MTQYGYCDVGGFRGKLPPLCVLEFPTAWGSYARAARSTRSDMQVHLISGKGTCLAPARFPVRESPVDA